MKRLLIACGTAALMCGAALADTVVIQPQVQIQVREYVATTAPDPVTGFPVGVGETVPIEVELHTFEGIPEVQQYHYVVVENRTVLVDPASRQVVTVIE